MIKGEKVTLSLVRQKYMDELFEKTMDLSNRGPHFPLTLTSESTFKSRFNQDGFWGENYGRMLILESDELVGGIWYFKTLPYSDSLEIGYIIYSENNKNKGLMTESLKLFTQHLFATRKLFRIELRILKNNIASIKVAENVGYQKEGVLRGAYFHENEHQDLILYSILRGEL